MTIGSTEVRYPSSDPAIDVRARSIIDVHAHYQPKSLCALLTDIGRRFYRDELPVTDSPNHISQRLHLMDSAGVMLQILSAGWVIYTPDKELAVKGTRAVNDEFSQLVQRYPDRFGAFASLPLPHIGESLLELQRSFDDLGMAGVTIHCSILEDSLASPVFEPIYAALDDRESVVLVHPNANGLNSALLNDFRLERAAGALMEDTVAALQLMVHEIPRRYPRIKFIVPHLGGVMPMLLQRLDNQLPEAYSDLSESPSASARRFWYDTVSHGSTIALTCARDAFGADRLVAGSDYPVLLPFEGYSATFQYIDRGGFPPEDVARILYGNARDAGF